MGFDLENFGAGLAVGWVSAYGVYKARHQIRRGIVAVRGGAQSAQKSATASADSRYVNDMIEKAETTHLGGVNVPLTSVLVQPRFIPAPRFAAPPDDDTKLDVFRVIPQIHDHPYLHAYYNVEAVSVEELGSGSRALALLGVTGSGRTTALMSIMLYSLGRLEFRPPKDSIQERLDNEEAQLSEKDRAVRVKERIGMEQKAKERLANERGLNFDAAAGEARQALPVFRQLMPVYVHLADVLAPTTEYGKEADPAELIVRAVQFSVKRVTSNTIPRAIYKRLQQGTILLLVDGYDELPEADQLRAVAWLKAFQGMYAKNFIVVTGPLHGNGPLLQIGLTPVYMRPWDEQDIRAAVQSWSAQAARLTGKKSKKAKQDADAPLVRALANSRMLNPAELTMKIWASFDDAGEISGYESWLRSALSRLIPKDMPVSTLLPTISELAAIQLDGGYISAAQMQALRMTGIESTESADQNPDSGEAADAKNVKQDSETVTSQGRLLASLRRGGLLIRLRGDRYQFRHPLLTAYAASVWLKDQPDVEKRGRAARDAWAPASAYQALHSPVDARVRQRLTGQTDILQSSMLEVLRWMAYAPADAAWRGDALKLFSALLAAPNQFPAARERIAAALLESRDRGTLLIFRKAVRNMNPEIRRLGCLCLGALGDAEGIRDLKPLLNDQVAEVKLAAAMALGAIGEEEAIEAMLIGFTEGSEQLRQAIAEAFATIPHEGYPILYEAATHEDMMLRRASILGLRRLRTTWALIAIYRAFLEDEQWYVRSAAQQAFMELQYGREFSLTAPYPTPDQIDWLNQWAADKGEKVPAGPNGAQMLVRVLQEGDAGARALAALSLGQLGVTSALKPLYSSMRDRQDDVRESAFRSLGALEAYIGERLPNPV